MVAGPGAPEGLGSVREQPWCVTQSTCGKQGQEGTKGMGSRVVAELPSHLPLNDTPSQDMTCVLHSGLELEGPEIKLLWLGHQCFFSANCP